MEVFVRKERYRGPVRGVILGWTGTAVDHGCVGALEPFREAFRKLEVEVSVSEIRRFMGLTKIDQVRAILAVPDFRQRWVARHGKEPDESAVKKLFHIVEKRTIAYIEHHADPIEGIPGFMTALHGRGVKIGSTTGSSEHVMRSLAPAARAKGFAPDSVVCASDVAAGRPYPWMAYKNALQLEIFPFEAMVKIGDTMADVQEGLNAGMWTIAVARTGNEMGLTADEIKVLPAEELAHRIKEIAAKFEAAGAHYVVESAVDALPLIDTIESRLARGESPLPNS